MEPVTIIATVNLLLSITGKVLDKLPNYSQKKRKQFYKLKTAYDEEINAIPKYRDDQKIDQLWDELRNFIIIFNQELGSHENEDK